MKETIAPILSDEVVAHQLFVQGLRKFWKHQAYAAVLKDFESGAPSRLSDPMSELQQQRSYQLYAWLERNMQQFKYLGRRGLISAIVQQEITSQDEYQAIINDARASERLSLDECLLLPQYYTDADFHQHPGGIWSDDADALVYEAAANQYSFSLTESASPYERVAAEIAELAPEAQTLVDLGCGFGKSTLPLARCFPQSRVVGIDLSAPSLKLAAIRSGSQLNVRWSQAAAECTGLGAGTVDVVLCYWLLHELPPSAVREVLAEARRILKPHGLLFCHDFYRSAGGQLGRFLDIGHSKRNNEPFIRTLLEMDIAEELAAAGFSRVFVNPADETAARFMDSHDLPPDRRHLMTVFGGWAE